jgi:hypothetical protein
MCKKSVLVLLVLAIFAFVFARESNSQAPQAGSPPFETAPPPLPLPEPSTRLVPIPAASQVPNNAAPKKLVNIWSMHIDQVDGRSVVLATIGKRNAIKITCDSVDYQTQKGMLQAQGKVEISAEDIRCSCDMLTIHLHENRLNLAFKAKVVLSKQKLQGEVTGKEDVLELQGEQLTLHWPELQIMTEVRPRAPVSIPQVSQGSPVPYVPK